ncbi:tetraacyldisaccharide 4'-kinase [Halomonas caseinilytica]|uniref:Tetraacyldisaccharide 4'-kinase n=1 Tax=Halomonas caseinilytica TaxID=438744 RepID=A0A1M6X9R2_9GAMM|nr:tetraacyldisaccharide 4'-kinase [Halomonas caseinilytica]SEM72895.1 lipid-A-disaccharide kinase [Halomonas caseinilytica]SHL02664.1 lipid-A-disaccharide kinase [Halomonas caseinilytica]
MTSLAERWLEAAYSGERWLMALRPLEVLYRGVMRRRTQAYVDGRRAVWRAPVPVVVVGNITLGGTGKSPLVAWLARHLGEAGWTPGILSRGYGGRSERYPLYLEADTPVTESGDEPRMLADQTDCPVVVDPDRPRGGRRLLEAGCDILISDDGLQHLALGRDLEIVVVDGHRGLGNGHCLPAGPLREPVERLDTVDAVMINGRLCRDIPACGHAMRLTPVAWRSLGDGRQRALSPLPFDGPVHALAGIGRPARFFETLRELGVEFEAHAFDDHHHFTAADLTFDDDRPVVMTAKDAVKCRDLTGTAWSLDVEAAPEPAFVDWLDARLAML